MSNEAQVCNPHGDFNEGIFYPNVFSDEDKKEIQSHKMYWLALEVFTQTQGQVLITRGPKSFERLGLVPIQFCTREGFWFGEAFYDSVDGKDSYGFTGCIGLKERGRDRETLKSNKPSYLIKKLREKLKQNLVRAHRRNSDVIHNALGLLRRALVTIREASPTLSSVQEIAMLEALYGSSGRHAINPQMDNDLRAKYEHYLKEDAKRQKQLEESADIFSKDGAWLVGVSESDVLIGSASISFSKDEFYKLESMKLRRYASLEAVEPEILNPLKLSLAMLKAHRGNDEGNTFHVGHDKDRLFPVLDKAYPSYGAAMYCVRSMPSPQDRHWMVIAK